MRKLLASEESIILRHSNSIISLVPVSLPDDPDFLFYSTIKANLTFYIYIIDNETSKIIVRNTCNCLLHIPRCHKLDYIIDIAYDNCFLMDT